MAKMKIFKCPECGKDRTFKKISKETIGMVTKNQSSVERAFLAVCSFGISEIPDKYYYECTKCGHILKKSVI